ncbi:hypothetical protein [Aneurinibacillus terranovensis]|uniref:hypothetical protein n=1 Tax=Aneurinibacillus terranovensis TaxID=278991 RepID=UPI001B7F8823
MLRLIMSRSFAYCLLLLVKLEKNNQHSLLQISRWLKVYLWQPFEQWIGRMDYQSNRTYRGDRKEIKEIYIISKTKEILVCEMIV